MKKLLFFIVFMLIGLAGYSQTPTLRVNLLRINRSTTYVIDRVETVICFRPTATRGYDPRYDAQYISGPIINLATVPVIGRAPMSINSMPQLNATSERLDLLASTTDFVNTYMLTFNLQNIDSTTTRIYLLDHFISRSTLINHNTIVPIVFSSNPATTRVGRFVLTYELWVTPTSIANGINTKAVINTYPNPLLAGQDLNIKLTNVGNQNVKVSVLDVFGRNVYYGEHTCDDVIKLQTTHLSSGLYTVKITSFNDTTIIGHRFCVE